MTPDRDKLTEIEKLRIAGYAAPRVRGDVGRPIKVVDRDGRVVRHTDSRELAETMHARAGIEFGVHLDAKPLMRSCSVCGRPFLMPKRAGGQPPKRCPGCRTVHKPKGERKKRAPRAPSTQTVCAGWDGPCPNEAKPGRGAFDPCRVTQRNGEPWRCRVCGGRKQAAHAGDRFSRAGKAGWAGTPEERSAHARAIHEAQTPEQRTERQRKAAETTKRRRAGGT